MFSFTIADERIWFRNYQILEENGELAEIGKSMSDLFAGEAQHRKEFPPFLLDESQYQDVDRDISLNSVRYDFRTIFTYCLIVLTLDLMVISGSTIELKFPRAR